MLKRIARYIGMKWLGIEPVKCVWIKIEPLIDPDGEATDEDHTAE